MVQCGYSLTRTQQQQGVSKMQFEDMKEFLDWNIEDARKKLTESDHSQDPVVVKKVNDAIERFENMIEQYDHMGWRSWNPIVIQMGLTFQDTISHFTDSMEPV